MNLKNHSRQRRFAARVRREMDNQELTCAQLGDRAKLTESAVWRLVNGKRRPTLAVALRVADALGIETGEL